MISSRDFRTILDIQPVHHTSSSTPPISPIHPQFKEPRMDGGSSEVESSAVSATVSLEELEAQITELAGHLNAANYRWLMLIAEFDRCTQSASYDGEELERTHAALGIPIDDDTAATRWLGERMDYDLGVWVLCNQANRARDEQDVRAHQEHDVSAERFLTDEEHTLTQDQMWFAQTAESQ